MSTISSRLVGFPNPVNEKAARVVAGLVVLTALTALVFQAGWLLWLLAAGFLLRVLSGPRFSPFGLLATRVVAPRLGRPKLVPGPPKRFAQGLGLTFSLAAAVCVSVGETTAGWVLVGLLVVAAAARVRLRVLPRLRHLRPAPAGRDDPGVGLRGVRGRLSVTAE